MLPPDRRLKPTTRRCAELEDGAYQFLSVSVDPSASVCELLLSLHLSSSYNSSRYLSRDLLSSLLDQQTTIQVLIPCSLTQTFTISVHPHSIMPGTSGIPEQPSQSLEDESAEDEDEHVQSGTSTEDLIHPLHECSRVPVVRSQSLAGVTGQSAPGSIEVAATVENPLKSPEDELAEEEGSHSESIPFTENPRHTLHENRNPRLHRVTDEPSRSSSSSIAGEGPSQPSARPLLSPPVRAPLISHTPALPRRNSSGALAEGTINIPKATAPCRDAVSQGPFRTENTTTPISTSDAWMKSEAKQKELEGETEEEMEVGDVLDTAKGPKENHDVQNACKVFADLHVPGQPVLVVHVHDLLTACIAAEQPKVQALCIDMLTLASLVG